MSDERLPLFLTVEEAGELLRIGRTKAYDMARKWRETEGRSGLPVIDLGNVLRVPRQALEDLLGAGFSDVHHPHPVTTVSGTVTSPEPRQPPEEMASNASSTQRSTRTDRPRRRNKPPANQLDLFETEPVPS